jgi:hypothetical protein
MCDASSMEGKIIEKGKHSCSNPNCGKIFSRPKVIKYYVCPSCQTLIDISTQKIPDHVNPIKKSIGRVREKDPQSESTPNQLVSNNEMAQSKENATNETLDLKQDPQSESTPNQLVSNNEMAQSKENATNETLDLKLEFITECESIDTSLEKKVQLAVEGRKVLSELNFQCSHYFGFLSEKKEGQEIPETCFECPKSVECLLSRCTKSEESIQEIKQWYIPNNQ